MSGTNEEVPPPQELPQHSRLASGLALVRTMLANPGALKRLWRLDPDEERYVRPPREYELPEYREGMPHGASNEKYLRPTRYCNPREPLVIAVANELGAYELSDYEFAEAAFWFVKTKLTVEFLPLDNVSETLKRGTGTCLHLNSVWLALCRAAGIKARYKSFNMALSKELKNFPGRSRTGGMSRRLLGAGLPEIEGEVCIDGKWVVGHVAMRPEILAFAHLPIPRFGEDAIGLTFQLAPGGKIKRFEGVPLWLGPATKVLPLLLPGMGERISRTTKETTPKGRKVIETAGGLEEYDRKARSKREILSEDEITTKIKEAQRPELVEFKG